MGGDCSPPLFAKKNDVQISLFLLVGVVHAVLGHVGHLHGNLNVVVLGQIRVSGCGSGLRVGLGGAEGSGVGRWIH